VIGGTEPVEQKYYNTAYVIGPKGDVVFKQAKSVPVQFFDDGLPARGQKLWNSPWGKIGLGICYDCSYRRVTDELVRQGAQALIFPTMDPIDWGAYEHRLHSRVGPMRAAEFGIPVMRLASSGVSQIIGCNGSVLATAPYPGQGSIISSKFDVRVRGRLPLDHYAAPICTAITFVLLLFFLIEAVFNAKTRVLPKQSVRVPVAKI
jgi:apolipoprotein N-acyltransferase